jgi:hypothetical protein
MRATKLASEQILRQRRKASSHFFIQRFTVVVVFAVACGTPAPQV